jgi:hypothetical protein
MRRSAITNVSCTASSALPWPIRRNDGVQRRPVPLEQLAETRDIPCLRGTRQLAIGGLCIHQ